MQFVNPQFSGELVKELSKGIPQVFHAQLEELGISAEDAQQIYNVFSKLDVNNLGSLSVVDMKKALQLLGQNPSKHDVDKLTSAIKSGGKLNFLDFARHVREFLLDESQIRQNLEKAFTIFDEDGSGELSRDELKNVLCFMGNDSLNENEFNSLMKEIDKDGNGTISRDEFVAHLLKGSKSKGKHDEGEHHSKSKHGKDEHHSKSKDDEDEHHSKSKHDEGEHHSKGKHDEGEHHSKSKHDEGEHHSKNKHDEGEHHSKSKHGEGKQHSISSNESIEHLERQSSQSYFNDE